MVRNAGQWKRDAMKFVAVDLGASGGRLMVGHWNESGDGRRFALEELHRFANGGVSVRGSVEWDVLRLWTEIESGLMKFKARFGDAPAGIAVDAWGVDFGLLDKHGRMLGNPTCYRDPRTNGIPEKVFARVSEAEIFAATGVQTMQINTLFQLAAMAMADDPRLECAETLLMIPDLLSYFLCGEKQVEYTEASTTQMYRLGVQGRPGGWDREMLRRVGVPERILPRVVAPGTVLGEAGGDVLEMCGFAQAFPVIAVASHDTASAVASIPGLDAESAFISSGTWSLMGVELDAPVTSERARELGFTNEGGCGGSTLLMRNITGLWILQECVRQWEKEGRSCSWDQLIAAAQAAEPFGSLIVPNAAAFQAPGNMLEAIRGHCRACGQAVPETVGEFARCCFESLSLAYWSTLEGLRALTCADIRTIRVVGGGCLNRFLCQMTADACGCMVVSGPAEASALGNVMLQVVAVGELPDVAAGRASIGESLELVEYAARRADGWDEARARYGRIEAGCG
jgi:rhamnulokinase